MAGEMVNQSESLREQGGNIAGLSQPAYTLTVPLNMSIPVIVAVPHAGRAYSEGLLAEMRGPGYSTLRLEDRYIDAVAADIAQQSGAGLLIAHAPRAMLDLNRASDDVDWDMIAAPRSEKGRHSQANRRARSGLGLVPRRLPGHGEIWKRRISLGELEARIDSIHRPYHAALGRALERVCDEWGAALLVDLHSMPPLKQRHPHEKPAQFVVGDRFGASCDAGLVARAFRYFDVHDRPAAHNRPYSGGFILDRHGAPSRGIHAIQLEVCRATYLDARLAEPSARMAAVSRMLTGLVRDLGAGTAALGQGTLVAQAAE